MTDRKDYPIHKILEAKSKFFCAAKWTELYLYLNHGSSNSCHHPIPHEIPEHLLSDPAVLHNTPHKLKMQQLMLDGHRPEECHMCWHIEDADPAAVSDRLVKSQQWQQHITDLKIDPHYVPQVIEVVFDNYCNLACSYCDSGQSSSWATRIHTDPLFLDSDQRQLYSKIHIEPGTTKTAYLDAWLKWWPEVRNHLQLIKVSGGEPLISKNFWKFVDSMGTATNLNLAINSNFSVDLKHIKRLADRAGDFASVNIGASIDATGDIAEYARQGLDYNRFLANVEYWCSQTPANCSIYLQSTVNILNVWGLTDKFDLNIQLRQRYPDRVQDLYCTVVRSPEFQSIGILPAHLKQQLHLHMQNWAEKNQQYLTGEEQIYIRKIIGYLVNDPEPQHNFTKEQLKLDFVKFLKYYDRSSKHRYQAIYPAEFLDWIHTI
jgi:pyruvate-formate lyase-activating enzyme